MNNKQICEKQFNDKQPIRGLEFFKPFKFCFCATNTADHARVSLFDGYFIVFGNNICRVLRCNARFSNGIEVVAVILCSFFIFGCALTQQVRFLIHFLSFRMDSCMLYSAALAMN